MSDILNCAERLVNMEDLVSVAHPRALVISRRESLLGRAVEYLTTDEREWMVLNASEFHNTAELLQKVDELHPAIVVISNDGHSNDGQLSMRILQGCRDVEKVITVSLQENMIEVYSKQKIQVRSAQDLFSEVENQFS